jgi:DTW domain-containing protein YfiP
MQRHVIAKNARLMKIGKLTFYVDDGKLLINTPDARFPYPLSACETLALLNLLTDFKIETILVAREEQRDRERRNKERQGQRKPKWVLVDGQWVEAVELSELEKEQNE